MNKLISRLHITKRFQFKSCYLTRVRTILFFVAVLFCGPHFAADVADGFPSCRDLSSSKIIRDSFGSTTPVWQIALNGKNYIVKFGGKEGHVHIEAAAFNFLRSLGLPVPKTQYYDENCSINDLRKGPFLLSEFIDGKLLWEALNTLQANPNSFDNLSSHVVLLSWAGVTGALGKCGNNVIVTEQGQFYFIDLGTVFGRTSSGKIDEEWFGDDEVRELKKFRNRIDNLLAADCFRNLALTDVIKQIQELMARAINYDMLSAIDTDNKIRHQLSRRLIWLQRFAEDKFAQKDYQTEVDFWATTREARKNEDTARVYNSDGFSLEKNDPYLVALRKGLTCPTCSVEFRTGYRHREFVLCHIPFQEGRRKPDGTILACDIEIYALQNGYNMPTLKSEPTFETTNDLRGVGIIAVEDDGRVWVVKKDEQYELPYSLVDPNRPVNLWSALFHARQTGLEITPTNIMTPIDLSSGAVTLRFYSGKRVGGDPGDIRDSAKSMMLLPVDMALKLLKGCHNEALKHFAKLPAFPFK